ncbi:MAG: beta-ketoacyl synthase N-terminal-like domain-containing protein [Planctomycetota bacterium]|jgi:hypothetical protein
MTLARAPSIRGWGVVTPLGGPEEPLYFERLLGGKRCVGPAPALVPDWEPERYITSRQLRRITRVGAFSLVATARAIENAALEVHGDRPVDDVGLVFASTFGATEYLHDFHRGILEEGAVGASPILFTNGVSNAPAGHLSLEYGIRGRCLTLIGGSLSALEALAEAGSLLHQRKAQAIVVCAGEEWSALLDHVMRTAGGPGFPGFAPLPPDIPLCEGGASLVLGTPGVGDRVLHPPSLSSPDSVEGSFALALETAIGEALASAGLDRDAPDLLVGAFREAETPAWVWEGLGGCFRGRSRPLPLASPRAHLGEGCAFLTLMEVITSVECLDRGRIPPFPYTGAPSPPSPFQYPETVLSPSIRHVLMASWEADGGCGAVVVSRM